MEHGPIMSASGSLDSIGALMPPQPDIGALSAVARALTGFNRDQLGSAIEVLIALMDVADGDPDAEADDRGGESVAVMSDPDVPPAEGEIDPDLEQTRDEDDWFDHPSNGPGCPIADPDHCRAGEDRIVGEYDAKPGDPDDVEYAHPEWISLPAASRRAGSVSAKSVDGWTTHVDEDVELDGDERDVAWLEADRNDGGWQPAAMGVGSPHEDAEDDDESGQCDEDGVNTNLAMSFGGGPGCSFSDPGEHWKLTFNVPVDPVLSAEHNIFNDQRVYLGYSNLMTSFVTGKEVRSADTGNVHSGLNLELKPGVPV